MIKSSTPAGIPVFHSAFGGQWHLASLPSLGKMKAMLPNWSAAGNPVIPQTDWYELDNRWRWGTADWIMDQNGFGACVGCGSTGALRRARAQAGMTDQPLAWQCTYAQINGGSDNGAVISDALDALMKTGTVPEASVQANAIYLRQLPAGWQNVALRFKIADGFHCSTWEELVSAILMGYIPFYGYMVGNNFENFDKYGVAGHDRGPGNHCNHGDGLKKLADGRWVIDDVNSWAFSWGPFQNGRVYIDQNHLFGGGDEPDVCVIRAAAFDPQDPALPPAAQ